MPNAAFDFDDESALSADAPDASIIVNSKALVAKSRMANGKYGRRALLQRSPSARSSFESGSRTLIRLPAL